jgi:manganese transport protein
MLYGENVDDHETLVDEKLLKEYQLMLTNKGFHVAIQLGFGKPDKVIPKLVNQGGLIF